MASQAGESGVALSPARAGFKPKGLKAGRIACNHVCLQYVWRGAMAGAAEVHGGDGIQPGGIQNMGQPFRDSPSLHRRYVLRAGTMTGLAGYPRDETRRIELATRRGSRVVAPEAEAGLFRIHPSA
jgi:hypothetical protein